MNNVTGPVETLLKAAVRAPSGDNTQPWRFLVDAPAGIIALQVDESRDPSPMNSGQVMARIAIGAALENLVRTARHNSWDLDVEKTGGGTPITARLHAQGSAPGKIEDVVTNRVTNRRAYDGRPLPDDLRIELARATAMLDGVSTHWIVDRERITQLATLVGRADRTMFGEPLIRHAFLANVRFDMPAGSLVEEGLSLASLELSSFDRLALRTMRWIPNKVFQLSGAVIALAAKARKLVESASGLCLVAAPDRTELCNVNVGQVVQRAWLALTEHGLAAQPMMSLLVLENILQNGPAELVASLGGKSLAGIGDDFRRLATEIGTGRPAFLMRFGFAPPPSGRTGRLPLMAPLVRIGS